MIYTRKALRFVLRAFSSLICDFIPSKKLRHKFRNFVRFESPRNLGRYFSKRYVDKCKVFSNNLNCFDGGYIFQCWWQGVKNAPPVVRKCIQSVEKFKGGRKHIIITKDNFESFVKLPDYILEKYKKGIISVTHLSDILRVCLLEKYGGFWVDATCLFSKPLPKWIEKNPFFMFQSDGPFLWTRIQNCFIYSKANYSLIAEWKLLLFKFWKYENCAYNYFFAHILFCALVDKNKSAANLYKRMPKVVQTPTHILLCHLFEKFDKKMFEKIMNGTFMHKLTYKFKKKELKKFSGSYLEFILNNDLDYILKSSPR